ncbi:MAG: ATP-grasp domain-containing protein [Planctomycetes bacterium]|nr:ATP-grasp domain-containing protein [Planctomycetota bacterium]
MSRSKPVVAVTGLECRDNPHPGVAIARALRAARGDSVTIIGLAYDATLTGALRNDLFDRVYLVPLPGDPAVALLARLDAILAEQPLDVLMPALDSDLALYALLRPALASRGVRMLIPRAEAVRARCKPRLAAFARRHGLFSPRTEVVSRPDTFFQRRGFAFPCFLKGALAEAIRVACQDEANAVFRRLAARWGYPVLAQEAVAGEEFDVCAVAAPSGAAAGVLCIKKTALSSAGKALAAEVVADTEPLQAGLEVLAALGWEGPLEIELIREWSSGRFFVMEVNARFPAWIGIAAAAGVNLPDVALRLALGEPLPANGPVRAGLCFLRGSRTTLARVEDLGGLLSAGRLVFHGE